MGHFLALALLALDSLFRAWRIQLAAWTAGGRLSFADAFRLNLYCEAASQLTPNRLGGEPARFLGLAEAGLRPVTALVAIGDRKSVVEGKSVDLGGRRIIKKKKRKKRARR